jgi:hypothetical protein
MRKIGSILILLAGIVLAWVLLAALTFSVGFYLVGVPPLWGAWILVAVTTGLWGWFIIQANWIGSRPEGGRPLMPGVWLALWTLAITFLMGQSWSWRMNKLQRELKAAGVPVSIADFAQDVPKSKNAAPAMEAWSLKFTRTLPGEPEAPVKEVSDAIMSLDGKGIMLDEGKEIDETWAWNGSSLGVLNKAANRLSRMFREVETGLTPILDRYDRRVAYDYKAEAEKDNPSFPKYAHYVNVGRIYRVMSERKAMQGDMAGAWRVVERQIKFANLIGQDPSLIAKMVSIALAGIAKDTASAIMKNKCNAVMPAGVVKAMAGIVGVRWVQDGFAGEIAGYFHTRNRFRKAGFWTPVPGYEIDRATHVAYKKLTFMGIMDAKHYGIVKNVFLPCVHSAGWVGDPIQKADWFVAYPEWIDRFVAWASAPRFVHLVQKQYEMQDRVKFALVASAIHSYKNRTGRYPAKLAALAPKDIDAKLLVDIFTNKEFGYKVTKAGYEISSPGPWGTGGDSKGQVMAFREPLPAGKPAKKKG